METVLKRNSRKNLIGTVTSRSGDKTIKVTYFYKIPHPLYRKEISARLYCTYTMRRMSVA